MTVSAGEQKPTIRNMGPLAPQASKTLEMNPTEAIKHAKDVKPSSIASLPVSLFASVMGLSGLSIDWRLANARFGAPIWIANGIAIVAVLAFLALMVAYAIKAVVAPGALRAEFKNPITVNLFGTVLISLLLLPIVLAPASTVVADVIWIVGACAMFSFALYVINRWMTERQKVEHATPVWMIPVVGLLDVPLATPLLGIHPSPTLMIGALAIGLFFALPLFTMIFSRLLFEPPLPEALRPTLLILVAPFAVGFSAYFAVMGQVDHFAEALYGLMLFVVLVLLTQLRNLAACCPFRVAWWAVSFPLAACAGAALRFVVSGQGSLTTDMIGMALLGLASTVIAWLTGRTLIGIMRGELERLLG